MAGGFGTGSGGMRGHSWGRNVAVMADGYRTVEDYLAGVSPAARMRLETIRAIVRRVAPDATEAISYQIPAFALGGHYLLYAGAWKRHVGMYPVGAVDAELEAELAPFRSGKATVRFPLDRPLPEDLVERLVQHAVDRHQERATGA